MTQTPCVTWDDCWTSRKSSCLAEPVTPSLVITEQARATTTKTTILLVLNPKIKRMLVVWCSGLATATSSWVQSVKIILDGLSLRGCLESKVDAQILLRRLVTSSSKASVWFQYLTFHASRNLDKVLGVQNILKIVQYKSGLTHSTQLSSLAKTDHCSTQFQSWFLLSPARVVYCNYSSTFFEDQASLFLPSKRIAE